MSGRGSGPDVDFVWLILARIHPPWKSKAIPVSKYPITDKVFLLFIHALPCLVVVLSAFSVMVFL